MCRKWGGGKVRRERLRLAQQEPDRCQGHNNLDDDTCPSTENFTNLLLACLHPAQQACPVVLVRQAAGAPIRSGKAPITAAT